MRFMAGLRLAGIALTVAIFLGTDLQFLKVFSQGVTHQCGTIPFRPARGLIGGTQEFFIENNLDCFHMSSLFHSLFHIGLHINNGIVNLEESEFGRQITHYAGSGGAIRLTTVAAVGIE